MYRVMVPPRRSREINGEDPDPIAAALAERQIIRQANLEAHRLANQEILDARREASMKVTEGGIELSHYIGAGWSQQAYMPLPAEVVRTDADRRARDSISRKERTNKGKSKEKSLPVQKSFNKFKKPGQQSTPAVRSTPSRCQACGKEHWGPCASGKLICYRCGKEGHFANGCPQAGARAAVAQIAPLQMIAAPPPPLPTGRVYTLDRQQSDRAPSLIRGIVLIAGCAVDVLFDSGASHSFIASPTALGLDLPISDLSPPLRVTTATGERCDASSLCKDVAFRYDSRDYSVDLLCLPMVNLEVILGMDWLSKNCVLIDCFAKKIMMSSGKSASCTLPHLSLLQARKALREGACGYIMLGGLVSGTQEDITSIPVVREFVDVFPDEIPQFPPEREVVFSIDLLPGVGPISLAPYRMSPVELAELKKHIEELSAKNFIRPSVSPWGAPVIFVKKKDSSMR